MGPHPRLTPWIDWQEWLQVKHGIFSTNISQQIWAVEVIKMWRVRGKIPHSVDSSADILEVILNDKQRLISKLCLSQRSETELKLMYSMCIVRAVNGLVEPSQQSYFASSIMGIASKIGLPSWFVDLRHSSTHGTLPSIQILKSACHNLLLWYKDNYWDQQEIYLSNINYSCIHYNTIAEKDEKKLNEIDEIISNSTELHSLLTRDSSFISNIFYPLLHQSINQIIEEITQQNLEVNTSSSTTSTTTTNIIEQSPLLSQSLQIQIQQEQEEQEYNHKQEQYNKCYNQIIDTIFNRFNKLLSDVLKYNKTIMHILLTSLTSSIYNYISQHLSFNVPLTQINHDLYFNVMNYVLNLIIENYYKVLQQSKNLTKKYIGNNDFISIHLIKILNNYSLKLNENKKQIFQIVLKTLIKFYNVNEIGKYIKIDHLINDEQDDQQLINQDILIHEEQIEQKNEVEEKINEVIEIQQEGQNSIKKKRGIEIKSSPVEKKKIKLETNSNSLKFPEKSRLWPLGITNNEINTNTYLYLLEEI